MPLVLLHYRVDGSGVLNINHVEQASDGHNHRHRQTEELGGAESLLCR